MRHNHRAGSICVHGSVTFLSAWDVVKPGCNEEHCATCCVYQRRHRTQTCGHVRRVSVNQKEKKQLDVWPLTRIRQSPVCAFCLLAFVFVALPSMLLKRGGASQRPAHRGRGNPLSLFFKYSRCLVRSSAAGVSSAGLQPVVMI